MADTRLSFFEAEGGHEATVIKSIVFACDLKPLCGFYDLTEDGNGRIVKPADSREKKVLWFDGHWADLGQPRRLRWLKTHLWARATGQESNGVSPLPKRLKVDAQRPGKEPYVVDQTRRETARDCTVLCTHIAVIDLMRRIRTPPGQAKATSSCTRQRRSDPRARAMACPQNSLQSDKQAHQEKPLPRRRASP